MGKIIHAFEGSTCAEVWLQAADYLIGERTACNVILGVANPVALTPTDFAIQEQLNTFFVEHDALPVATIATTIFPGSEYLHGGRRAVYEEFPKTFAKTKQGWGTYAMRLLAKSLKPTGGGPLQSPLEQLVSKMKRQKKTTRMRSIYEASLIEDADLLTDFPIYRANSDRKYIRGGPCLSHLSFKLLPNDSVNLTAMYRYHYYVQRALGNLFGLSQLLAFVAAEVGVRPGHLVCHSTYAVIDIDGGWTFSQAKSIISRCKKLTTGQVA